MLQPYIESATKLSDDIQHVLGQLESLCEITMMVSTVVRLSILRHTKSVNGELKLAKHIIANLFSSGVPHIHILH